MSDTPTNLRTPLLIEKLRTEAASFVRDGKDWSVRVAAANLMREAAGELASKEWRPIETHDKTRDSVLIAVIDGGTGAVFVGEGFYDADTADWWWANETPGDYHASSIEKEKGWRVTHWMPLPDPPVAV